MGLFVCIWKPDFGGKNLIRFQKCLSARACDSCKLAGVLFGGPAGIELIFGQRQKLYLG